MDSVKKSYINSIHSLIIGLISFWEFKESIMPTPEVYFSMFLALLAITFTNNIRSGNPALTRAALICAIIIFLMQINYSIPVFQDKYLMEKVRKVIMLLAGVGMISSFLLPKK